MKENTGTAKTKARWERLAEHYGLVEFLSEWILRAYRKTLWSHASGRILEAGVGTGLNIPYYPEGARVTATDLSGTMIRKARERARGIHRDIVFEEADLCHLPFEDGAFDTAAATFVFCSVPEPVACLREMSRVTNRGGRILLLDHVRIDRPWLGPLMDRINVATVRLAGEHINHRMDAFVREAGLEIVESRRCGLMGLIQFIVARPAA